MVAKRLLKLTMVAVFMLTVAGAQAQVPQVINYQGQLTDASGNPSNGSFTMLFEIFGTATGGTTLYSETQTVTVTGGVFNVLIGSATPVPLNLFDSSADRYLQVTVSGTALTPRRRFGSVPYAFTTRSIGGGAGNTLDQAYDQGGAGAGRTITADAGAVNIAGAGGLTVNGNVGVGTTNPARKLHLSNNTVVEMIMEQFDAQTNFKRWNFIVGGGSAAMPSNFYIRQLNDAGTDGNIPLLISGTGNVGIGTTNPARKLHLSNNTVVEMIMEQSDAKTNFKRWNFAVAGGSAAMPSNFFIRQLNDAGTDGNIPLLISGTGDVGIGTTNPARKLHLSNNTVVEMIMEQSDAKTNFKRWNFVVGGGSAAMPSNFYIRQLNDAGTSGNAPFAISGTGNVGIGTTNPQSTLDVAGTTTTKILTITGGADLAEPFSISNEEAIPAGAVVIIDEDHPGQLKLSEKAYDTRVAGIISGAGGVNPGLTLSQEDKLGKGQNVALSGRVYVQATAANGAIQPGDMLTTSDSAGHAMKATNREKSHGTVIGKAMSRLEQGEGLVLVLVNLQ